MRGAGPGRRAAMQGRRAWGRKRPCRISGPSGTVQEAQGREGRTRAGGGAGGPTMAAEAWNGDSEGGGMDDAEATAAAAAAVANAAVPCKADEQGAMPARTPCITLMPSWSRMSDMEACSRATWSRPAAEERAACRPAAAWPPPALEALAWPPSLSPLACAGSCAPGSACCCCCCCWWERICG